MAEKADLLDQLQENEHIIVQLSGETETIGKDDLPLLSSAEGLALLPHLHSPETGRL